jgi:hypothetical protein
VRGEHLSERRRVLPDPLDPFGPSDAGRLEHARGHATDRVPQLGEDVGGFDPCVPTDRDHRSRPDEQDPGAWADLASDLDRCDADPVVEHDDIGLVDRQRLGELDGGASLGENFVAGLLEHGPQQTPTDRPVTLSDHDQDTFVHPRSVLPSPDPGRLTRLAYRVHATGGHPPEGGAPEAADGRPD